jgi:hypothetical protein
MYSYMYIMYFDHIHSITLLSPLSSPLFTISNGFHHPIFTHSYNDHTHAPSLSTLALSPSSCLFPPIAPILYSCIIFTSRFLIWDKMCYLSFSVWLISLDMMIFSYIHFPTHNFVFLYGQIIFHCLYNTHFL